MFENVDALTHRRTTARLVYYKLTSEPSVKSKQIPGQYQTVKYRMKKKFQYENCLGKFPLFI